MAERNRQLQGTEERSALKLPIPLGLSYATLNFTVLEDESPMATIGRGRLMRAVDQLNGHPHPTVARHVISIGPVLSLPGGRYTVQNHWAEILRVAPLKAH